MGNKMIMHEPLHPGEMLKEDFIGPMVENNTGLTITNLRVVSSQDIKNQTTSIYQKFSNLTIQYPILTTSLQVFLDENSF